MCMHLAAKLQSTLNPREIVTELKEDIRKYKIISDYSMYKEVNNYKVEANKILDDKQIASIELKRYI